MKRHNQEIAVCFDCLSELANGETPGAADPTRAVAYVVWAGDCEVTLGGKHADDCPNHPDWQGVECDCENLGFTWEPCQLCTSDLAGDKYLATIWWD